MSELRRLREENRHLRDERQAVLDVVNIYGDDTLHSALDNIGWFQRQGGHCGRLLVGQGDDTYDPECSLPPGHEGICKP